MITTSLLFVRTVSCKSCNIRIIHGMYAAGRSAGNYGKNGGERVERSHGYACSPLAKADKYAVEMEGSRFGLAWARDEERGGGQSTDFGVGIAEFQWTRWPRKPIAVHLPHFAFSFFSLCFENLEEQVLLVVSNTNTLLRLESVLREFTALIMT